MTTIQRITYTGSNHPIRGAVSARKLAIVLAGIDAPSNAERLEQYAAKVGSGVIMGKARTARAAA